MSKENAKPPPPPGDAGAGAVPPADGVPEKQTGRVKFDDRGNAVWEWAVTSGAFGSEPSTQRLKKLENAALSIAEDTPPPAATVTPNPHGTIKGYDPYESGKLGNKPAPRKKDLKKLGEWIALRKQASNSEKDDE